MRERVKLAIVVPCYNEEEMLPLSAPRLVGLMQSMIADGLVSPDSFMLYVDDGSRDSTWSIIEQLHMDNPMNHGMKFSRNCGHQNAILAGMLTAVQEEWQAGAVITIDADLQDPLECIPEMVREYLKGSDVVYGVRESRESDTFMKRFTAESFYKLQARLGVKTIYNHADFRLMSRKVVLELSKYEERNLYLRGIIPMLGFPSSRVLEVRAEREAGTTKYTLTKMLRLALDGITSFSITPIYIILALGFAALIVALGIGIYVIVALTMGRTVPGWSSLMLSLWLIGGLTMISIGVVGLYVGKVYMEVKHRPRYHIQKII